MAEQPMNQKGRYLSYLLRLWRESAGGPPLWRASLERPQGGERLGFAGLVELFAFLEDETRSDPPGSELPDEDECEPSV